MDRCRGCKSMAVIWFETLHGWQNIPLIQGIKMQGVQNLVRDSVRNYAGVAMKVLAFKSSYPRRVNAAPDWGRLSPGGVTLARDLGQGF